MKKTLTLIPTALLAVCSVTGCDNSPKNLSEFVSQLSDGEHTKSEIEPMMVDAIISSSDEKVTSASYEVYDYVPYSALTEGLEESEYEQAVHDLHQKQSYTRYDNDVVVTDETYSNYGYDKDMIDLNDGISRTESAYVGTGYLYSDEDKTLHYTYTQDKNPSNSYSFTYAKKVNDDDKNKILKSGGLSDTLLSSIKNVEEWYADYASYVDSYDFLTANENYVATKAENKLNVSFKSSIDWEPYSLEFAWGWEYEETADGSTDYTKPIEKVTDHYDGYYLKQQIIFNYDFSIVDGFITDAYIVQFGYVITVYKDKNWKSGDPTPKEDLTDEDLAKLDLEVAETMWFQSEDESGDIVYTEYENPYNGKNIYTRLMYTIEKYTTSGASNGDFDTSKLPDASKYREDVEGDDVGAWISVQDIVELEEAE